MEKQSDISKEDALKFLNGLYSVVEEARLTKKEHVQLDNMYVKIAAFITNTGIKPLEE